MSNPSEKKNALKKGSYGVFDVATEAEIEHAIEITIDENVEIGDIGNEPVFRFCQYLKPIIPPAENPADTLEPFVKEFFDQHEGLRGHYKFFEVMLIFDDIWDNDKVKHPKMVYSKIALVRADKQTAIRPEAQWCKDSPLLRLDNYCYQLQKLWGKHPIFVSQYQAGKIMGIDARIARRAIDKIERMKNLKRHKKRHPSERLANEYFYIGQAEPVKKLTTQTGAKEKTQKMIDDLKHSEEG